MIISITKQLSKPNTIRTEDRKKWRRKTWTMYIAYSALQISTQQTETNNHETSNHELLLRYHAYQTTCNKYSHEIAAIQKYIPNWQPSFR